MTTPASRSPGHVNSSTCPGDRIEGPLAEAARRVAREITGRLVREEVVATAVAELRHQTSYPDIHRWDPLSLAMGDPGLALLCTEAAGHFPDEDWHRLAHRFLAAGVRTPPPTGRPLALFDGLTGFAAAVTLARQRWSGYTNLTGQLHGRLLPAMLGAAETLAATAHAAPPIDYDVISGLSGWNAYLRLQVDLPEVRRTRSAVVHALVAALRPRNGVPGFVVPGSDVLDEQRADAPHGYVDCGLAHGVPGALAALALTRTPTDAESSEVENALRVGADWVAEQVTIEAGRVSWPRVIRLAADGTAAAPVPAGEVGWCYGTAGVARSLWLVGQALDEERYRLLALRAIRSVCRNDLERFHSPTLCHGLAGLLLIVACFWWDTGDPALGRGVHDILARLLDFYDPALPLGFQDEENTGAHVDNPGLLNGAAGVGVALMAITGVGAPDWTRLFLLS